MNQKRYNLYWGDMHTNISPKRVGMLRKILRAARKHLDFMAVTYYPFIWYTKNGLKIESCGHRARFDEDWKTVQRIVAEENSPGEFVTFLGYEWHGDRRRYGDHNVYYLNDYSPLDSSETLPQLYENLRRTKGIAIPHHTGYQVGERGKDWNFYDEDLSPFVEIYSAHGSSEGCDTPIPMESNMDMGPRVSGGTVQDGLKRGYRIGIIASGDNRDFPGVWGNGLAAVYAEQLTRESIWEAFINRRVYGVTGDRIKLNFYVDGHMMGEIFKTKNEEVEIEVDVTGSHAIDRIEIIKNGTVAYTYCHSGRWRIPDTSDPIRAKLRIECGWGPNGIFGFKKAKPKVWNGTLEVEEGRIVSLEPCFTDFGQEIKSLSNDRCEWILTTKPRVSGGGRTATQGLIFEIEAAPQSIVRIKVKPQIEVEFTLKEAMETSRVIALLDEAERTIYEEFSLSPEDVENKDTFWHNAFKMKIHKAIPREGYKANLKFRDRLEDGRCYYYVRVSQLNRQMAWSSPIWIIKE